MVKPLVKICGITRAQDAALALEAGADAIGLNFFGGPRKIDYRIVPDMALPAGIIPVGLVAYPEPGGSEFAAILAATKISTFQFYSDRYPSEPNHSASRAWVVAAIDGRASLRNIVRTIASLHWTPAAVVLDTHMTGRSGGTGDLSFDWNWIAAARADGDLAGLPPMVLAGGLNPQNVAEAVRMRSHGLWMFPAALKFPASRASRTRHGCADFVAAAKGD